MMGSTRDTPNKERTRSDSLEPWDERNSKIDESNSDKSNNNAINITERMRRDRLYHNEDDQEPELEDGELPRLTLSRSTSTKREQQATSEMAPMRSAEDSELRRQRDFWKQLDARSSLSHENGHVAKLDNRRTHHHPSQSNVNGSRYRDQQKQQQQQLQQQQQSLGRNDSYDTDDDESRETKEYLVNENENSFCDQTLSAMEAICGDSAVQQFCGGAPSTNTQTKVSPSTASNTTNTSPTKKAKNLNILKLRDEADSVDEHTAIEVEYVEPEAPNNMELDRPENWSPSRKNAYLAAMARKAKEDFEKSQAKEMESISQTTMLANNQTNHYNYHKQIGTKPPTKDSDIYNSFTAAEKRKFLRLINSGMTPKESAERINAERNLAKASKPKKGKLFKFWKKGSKSRGQEDDGIEPTSTPPRPDRRNGFPHEEKKEDDRLSVEDIGRLQKQIIPSPARYATSSSESANDDTRQSYDSQSPSHSQSHTSHAEDDLHKESSYESTSSETKRPTRESATEDRLTTARETTEILAIASKDSLADDPATTQRANAGFSTSQGFSLMAVGEPEPERKHNSSGGRELTVPPSSASADANNDSITSEKRFAVSGINYYDAVRREVSGSEAEDELDSSNVGTTSSVTRNRSQSSGSRLGPILHSPRLQGFSKLVRGDSRSLDEENAEPAKEISASVLQDETENRLPTAATVTPDGSTKTVQGVMGESRAEPKVLVVPRTSDDLVANANERSVDSTGKKTPLGSIGEQAEEAVLGKVEDVLLRPVVGLSARRSAKMDGFAKAETVPKEPRLLLESTSEKSQNTGLTPAQFVSPATSRTNAAAPTAAQNVSSSDIDVAFDIQQYLNATEVYSHMGDVNESMSVTSGKSFSMESGHGPGSVYTQSTNFTQSSRKRRPGAAKTRLAKAKEAEKQSAKKGWHESIRAAAETNKRIWKPKLGWVGYQHSTNEAGELESAHSDLAFAKKHDLSGQRELSFEGSSLDKIHLTLPVSKKPSKEEEGRVQDFSYRPQDVSEQRATSDMVHRNLPVADQPTPSDPLSIGQAPLEKGLTDTGKESVGHVESDRSAEEAMKHPRGNREVPDKSSRMASPAPLDDISLEQSIAYSVEQFVQSVGAVSPTTPVKKKPQKSPGPAQRHATPNSKQLGWANSMMAASERIGNDKQVWDPVSGWITPGDNAQGGSIGDSFSADGKTDERQVEVSDNFREQRKAKPIPISPEPSTPLSILHPADQRDTAKTKAFPPGNFNATAAVGFGGRIDQPEGKVDKIPLLDPAKRFSSGTVKPTPMVNVVRERVNEEDINWFPESRRSSYNGKKGNSSAGSMEGFPSCTSGNVPSGTTASRSERNTGLVNVDDVNHVHGDDSEGKGAVAADDYEEHGVIWKGVVFESDHQETSLLPGNESAGTIKGATYITGDLSKSGSSVAGSSQFSKIVPKLTSSKKDTSPIHTSSSGLQYPLPSKNGGTPSSIWRDNSSREATPVAGRLGADPNGSPSRAIHSSPVDHPAHESTLAGSHVPMIIRNGSNTNERTVQTVKNVPHSASLDRPRRDESRPDDPSSMPTRAPWRRDVALVSRSPDVNVAQQEESDTQSAVSSTVKLRARQWETRGPADSSNYAGHPPGEPRLNAATAVWVGKKVRAEGAFEHSGLPQKNDRDSPRTSLEQTDSLFEFSVGDGASVDSQSPPRGTGMGLHNPYRSSGAEKSRPEATRPLDGRAKRNSEPEASVVSDNSDVDEINKSFLTRLAGCAGPIMAKRQAGADTLSHLSFLRTKNLCGRPDVILEERESEGDVDDPAQETVAAEDVRNGFTSDDLGQDAFHNSKAKNEGIQTMGGSPSVISEDFGAKTAYLEALAMKTAVSKPRKSDSQRRHRSSASSDVSTSSSMKWREFLDRRREEASARARPNGSEASSAAENYAAQKVEEMMAMMASRSKSTPRSWRTAANAGATKGPQLLDSVVREPNVGRSGLPSSNTKKVQKSESIIAAEQLAAARVNAMMQALASSGMEEGEI